MRTLRFLLRKEYRQIVRDRVMLAQMILLPIIQLALLANAASFEVTRARLAVVDDDRSASARGLVRHLAASGRFVVVPAASTSMPRANDALLGREVSAILRVPRGFERDLVRDRAAALQLVLDAQDGAAAGVTQSYAQRVVAGYAAELGGGAPAVEVRTRGWYNPELEYRDFMVPGILVQLITLVGTLLTATNIAREKEIGTLDQLNVTPVTRGQFIAGKLIPLWSIALAEFALGLLVARLLFGVPMRGSPLLALGIGAVYLVVALGLGLWISTLVETQQQAILITFFLMLVYLLMSGLFTPVRSMPPWAQWVAELNPLKHFIGVMRAIMLKGAGPADVARPVGILALMGAVVFTLAVRQYTKRSG
jgi:ABC-2 type transport system permease protein